MIEESLLAVLNGLKITLIHPDAQSGRALSASLSPLGCQITYCWPAATPSPAETDLLLLAVEPHYQQRAKQQMSEWTARNVPVIVLADVQHPSLFPLLIELKPAAILDKVINPFALIVQIIGTLNLVRECHSLRRQLAMAGKNDKQTLAQAKGILMHEQGMDENTAYHFIRREAMNRRSNLNSTAESVIRRRGRVSLE